MVCVSVLFYISRLSLGVPFYRSRGGTRLQNVGARVGLVRGMARANSRLPYRRCLNWSCYGIIGYDGACTS